MGELLPKHRKLTQDIEEFKDSLESALSILRGKTEDKEFEFLEIIIDDIAFYGNKIKKDPVKYYESWFND